MKPIILRSRLPKLCAAACFIVSAGTAPAANLLLDFGPTTAATTSLTLSPGHAAGTVTGTETNWNKITSSAQVASLDWSDGTDATDVTLTMGQGSKSSSTITYNTAATFTGSLAGSGGSVTTPATMEKLTTNKGTSIYGPATGSTTVALDALYSLTNDISIGFRVDGLTVGDYLIYVMARNTSTNAATGAGLNVYATTGALSSTFNYSSATMAAQSNPGYVASTYTNQYGSFLSGENYVVIPVTVGEDQSLFVSTEGQGTAGSGRGFINMIQIVQIPEPSITILGALGMFGLLRRRRN